MSKKIGKIIAAFGIPGCGKSTTTKIIGELLNIQTFHEPEENYWPIAVTERKISGNFTAVMWFRSMRIPLIYEAEKLKKEGYTVMLDSFYDKLFHLYFKSESIEWLIDKDDKYFSEMESIAKKDYELLPDIDCLVYFKIDKKTWTQFISERNRNLDNELDFRNKCFDSQDQLLSAAKKYSEKIGCELIIFDQVQSSPFITAKKIVEIFKNKQIA